MQMNFAPSERTPVQSFFIPSSSPARITSWSVAPGDKVRRGVVLLSYNLEGEESIQSNSSKGQLKSTVVGVVRETMYNSGEIVPPGAAVVSVERSCDHSVVVYDLCADCGLNLRKNKSGPRQRPGAPTSDRISMVHGNPEIQISREEAKVLGNKDKLRLLQNRKLALIIDLDQTLIHTSVDPNIEPGLSDVYGFRLPGHPVLYHCRLRPHARQFLLSVSKLYETHVFTMGTKHYAVSVTHILDPDKKLFYGRIISRDDCFDPHSKALRLKSVFPCGDAMVAIIDDREDVWGRCPNLIHVKPYVFFAGTSDINAPPGSQPTPSHPSHPHMKNNPKLPPSIPTHASHPHRSTSTDKTPPNPTQNTIPNATAIESNTSNVSPTGIPESDKPEESISLQQQEENLPAATISAVAQIGPAKPDSSSSSNSDSESEGSSSSASSSDIDDTLFDSLENPLNESQNLQSTSNETMHRTAFPAATTKPVEPIQVTAGSQNSNKRMDEKETAAATKQVGGENKIITGHSETEGAPEENMEVDFSSTPILSDIHVHKPVSPIKVPPTDKSKAKEIKDPDNFLLHLTDTLKRVHKAFYTEYDTLCTESNDTPTPDLKRIIPKIRQSVLKGTKILFTGVIPTNMPPEKSPEWNTARAFGASIHDRFVYGLTSSNPRKVMQATTHVIAGRPGTSKLREARRIAGIKIVNPKWLWSCAEQWKLVDERKFPVQFEDVEEKKPSQKMPKITSQGTKTDLKKKSAHEDNIFSNDASHQLPMEQSATVKQQPLRAPERHMSIESVSDEELERMNAEVDAEIEAEVEVSSSSSSDPNEEAISELGTFVEAMDDDDSLSYEKFAGINSLGENGRKRKHDDVSSSSDNSPQSIGPLDESADVSDRGNSDSDSGDELAALLGT